METANDLTITVRIDTSPARREVAEFREYAMQVLEEIKAAYAGPGQPVPGEAAGAGLKRRV